MAKIKQTQSKKRTTTKKAVAPKRPLKKTVGKKAVSRKVVAKKTTVAKTRARKQTKKLLVPHKTNDYRPFLIRPQGIIAFLVIALLAQIVYGFVTTGHLQILGRVSNITTEELLYGTNDERREGGIQQLALNEELSEAAFLKAQDMFANDYWAHTSPDGVTPWKWLGDAGYNYSVAGENLAKNYPNAEATVSAWMASESHRMNIMNDKYTDVGFAVVDGTLGGRQTTLVVAYYGAPVIAAVQGSAFRPVEYSAPVASGGTTPFGYFASALQSLSPVTIISLGFLALVAIVGAAAHHYRKQLPKSWQRNWKKHHGMYTFFGMIGLGVLVILTTGGGSL